MKKNVIKRQELPMSTWKYMLFSALALVTVSILMLFAQHASGADYTVTNTNNSGAGSLRQAIIDSNNNPGTDTISFNIPISDSGYVSGSNSYWNITPNTQLPAISDPVIIDGYTQPGASANTKKAPNVSNADIKIEIDGGNSLNNGFRLNAGSTTIKGVSIVNFTKNGINVNSSDNIIEGSYIGINTSGTIAKANNRGILIRNGSTGNNIGQNANASRNVISGNTNQGIRITGDATDNNILRNNFIGTDYSGSFSVPNSVGINIVDGDNNRAGGTNAKATNLISSNTTEGIYIDGNAQNNKIYNNIIGADISGLNNLGNGSNGVLVGSSDNSIGGTNADQGNLIVFNGANGVRVKDATSVNNAILGNTIHDNTLLGIELRNNGVSSNDFQDVDTGVNNLQNFPIISQAEYDGVDTIIKGDFNSTPSTTGYRIEIYANSMPDDTDHGEGELFIGSYSVDTDTNGDVGIYYVYNGDLSNKYITATATDPNNNTSEFGPMISSDVSVTKIGDTSVLKPGQNLVYTITVANDGPDDSANLQIKDILPVGLDIVNISATAGAYSTSTSIWSLATLANGSNEQLTITVTPNVSADGGDRINEAELIATDNYDPDSTIDNNVLSEDDQDSYTVNIYIASDAPSSIPLPVDESNREDLKDQDEKDKSNDSQEDKDEKEDSKPSPKAQLREINDCSNNLKEYNYELVDITESEVIPVGEKRQVSVTLQNTGPMWWYRSNPCAVNLITILPEGRFSGFYSESDNSWISYDKIRMNESIVKSGGTASFTFDIYANPDTKEFDQTNTHVEKFAPYVNNLGHMGYKGINWNITVVK